MTISRACSHFKLIIGEQVEIKGRIANNLIRVEYSLPVAHFTKILVNLWHQHLGHPGSQAIKSMGLPEHSVDFSACDLNKIHQVPFNHHFEHVNKPLDCIHIDLVGPVSPPSVAGN
ncbi:hypothetical protein O181_086362 [Austropuccinia psidii MF-1]|uniref:GAG-pre-integrase domain-containing protein n=1 Tax=Austropuccinia psidii MF-1 TaxID=1389203 RepID=A0A9Q3FZM5_9BASI|nr:hypothetical protein [Austropuccinia psidii MF-1]